jgi:hypothetical protein
LSALPISTPSALGFLFMSLKENLVEWTQQTHQLTFEFFLKLVPFLSALVHLARALPLRVLVIRRLVRFVIYKDEECIWNIRNGQCFFITNC